MRSPGNCCLKLRQATSQAADRLSGGSCSAQQCSEAAVIVGMPTRLSASVPGSVLALTHARCCRYYSIASSSWVVGNEVHLIVGSVQYALPDGTKREGHCSSYLDHLRPGEKVRFRVLKASSPGSQGSAVSRPGVVWCGTIMGLAVAGPIARRLWVWWTCQEGCAGTLPLHGALQHCAFQHWVTWSHTL